MQNILEALQRRRPQEDDDLSYLDLPIQQPEATNPIERGVRAIPEALFFAAKGTAMPRRQSQMLDPTSKLAQAMALAKFKSQLPRQPSPLDELVKGLTIQQKQRELNPEAPKAISQPEGITIPEGMFWDPVEAKIKSLPAKTIVSDKEQAALDAGQLALENQKEMVRTSAEDMLETIEKAKVGVDKKYFGPLGELPTYATPQLFTDYKSRTDWEANINKLLSSKIVNLMNEMKQASRTGATGFGQLNRSELKLLQDASTALNRRLDPQTAQYYLDEMEKIAKRRAGIQETRQPTQPNQSGRFIVEEVNG